ncbi:MFS transporter, partial [Salmonella enterica]|nr:MFS transporter [Salmonella enterica]
NWPTWTLACGAASVALLALFVWMQRRAGAAGRAPLGDMTLLAQPRFAAGCLLVTLVFYTASAMFLCYALLLQTGLGVDALTAGTVY